MNWQRIIVHHSASMDHPWLDMEAIDEYHKSKGWKRIGYHRVIEKVSLGYVGIIGRPTYMEGSHTRGWNTTALGVCFIGNFEEGSMTGEQLDKGAEVVAELCLAFSIPLENIWKHKDCGNTLCPGEFFPFNDLVVKVRQIITEVKV